MRLYVIFTIETFLLFIFLGLLTMFVGSCGVQQNGIDIPVNKTCTIVDTATGALIECPDGTRIDIEDGQDEIFEDPNDPVEDESCTVTETVETVYIRCPDGTESEIPLPVVETDEHDPDDDLNEPDENHNHDKEMTCKRFKKGRKRFRCKIWWLLKYYRRYTI